MFHDRADAGRQLAERLTEFANRSDVLVMGLLRGGIPVAYEIAKALHAVLDLLLIRKLGAPSQPELAIGAIGTGGIRIIDWQLVHHLGLSHSEMERIIALQEAELRRREELYRDVRPEVAVQDHIVIVADDGIATGASMMAAISVLRSQQPKQLVVAVPVVPKHARKEMERVADKFVCLQVDNIFPAVGAFYRDFSQTEDHVVRSLLIRSVESRERNDKQKN
jgi:putative phosphoribosyl transferase